MKFNKLLIVLALCAAIQSNVNFCMEVPESQSYWQSYAPEFMQRGTRYVSEKTTNLYNTINSWSTQKKLAMAGTTLTALAAIYNRDQIMQWVDNIFKQSKLEGMAEELILTAIANKKAQNNLDWFETRSTKTKYDAIEKKMQELVDNGTVNVNDAAKAYFKSMQKHWDEL